jgi:hypothetical protein
LEFLTKIAQAPVSTMMTTRPSIAPLLLAVAVAVALGAVACGRSDLDLGQPTNLPALAGAAGADGVGGAGGHAGAPSGTAGADIPCGDTTCRAGLEVCCVRFDGGQSVSSCIAAGAACPSGATIGCLDTPSCRAGDGSAAGNLVCCLSPETLSTSCEPALACLPNPRSPGLILCGTDAECPSLLAHCCGAGGLKVCLPGACVGPGGGPGPGR